MIRCDPEFLFSYLPIHRRPAAGKSPDGRSSFATGETQLNNTKKALKIAQKLQVWSNCTKNRRKVWEPQLSSVKIAQRTFSKKKICRGNAKNLCQKKRLKPHHILFDMRAMQERYYSSYEKCVNMKPDMDHARQNGAVGVDLKKEVSGMISFLLCLALLIVGYFVYGKIVDNTFGPDDRETPAVRINDGVDYVVMPQWKLFLVQLLNIAGLGPIFGALQGALWGPVVFLWITFGTIFAGGVHDYFSGMMSERNEGASIAEVTGKYLGPVMQNIMRVFSVVLLIMVGTVFAVGPAGLIVTLCKNNGMSGVLTTTLFWLIIILVYYFIATFISIDAIIGKIYPVFGICLIIMAVGVIFGIFTNPAYTIPELWDHFGSMHPSGTPIWSFMFITVACGAISGFHSTQSPLMARCMKSEKQGHFVFYGAMVCEGIIALIWAAAGCSLYEVTGGLNTGLAAALAEGQSAAIYDVCSKTMGGIGIALAMIGVVICPITSGDTAFRSARLTLADWLKLDQDSYANRLKLCIPVLGVGSFLGIGNALGFINYTVIWRYFSWTNQTLAMIVLWAASMYLFKEKKNYWITAVPATFMSAVSCTYFVLAPECLGGLLNSKTAEGATIYNTAVAYPVGIIFAVAMLALFIHATKKHTEKKAA